jgi:hypothetical protein
LAPVRGKKGGEEAGYMKPTVRKNREYKKKRECKNALEERRKGKKKKTVEKGRGHGQAREMLRTT